MLSNNISKQATYSARSCFSCSS